MTGARRMHTVLWGRDHVTYGEVAAQALSPAVAVAITRGVQPKPYAWVDPNEDVVAAAVGERATLLVVADGHNGAESSEVAVRYVLDRLGADPPAALRDRDFVGLFTDTSNAVAAATADLRFPNRESRTTLTVALLAGRKLAWAGMGDSVLVVVGDLKDRELTVPRNSFVGWPTSTEHVKARLARGAADLRPGTWVVLASDGFSNYCGPVGCVQAAAEALAPAADAEAAARALVHRAGAGGAGDNVAVAVAAVM